MVVARKQMAIAAAAVIITAVFFAAVFVPLSRWRSNLKAAELELAASVARAASESQNLPMLAERIEALEASIGEFSARIPDGPHLGDFLQSVATIMNHLQLDEQLVQPGSAVETEQLYCIPVTIQCKGSLEQIFLLVGVLQKLERALRIESLELVNDRGFEGSVNLHSRVYVYYKNNSGADI